MNEKQFDHLLRTLCWTMRSEQLEFALEELPVALPVAANDNDGPWPLLPFPEGWTASC